MHKTQLPGNEQRVSSKVCKKLSLTSFYTTDSQTQDHQFTHTCVEAEGMRMFFMILACSCHFESKTFSNLANFSPHFGRNVFFWPETRCLKKKKKKSGLERRFCLPIQKGERSKSRQEQRPPCNLATTESRVQLQNESWLRSPQKG